MNYVKYIRMFSINHPAYLIHNKKAEHTKSANFRREIAAIDYMLIDLAEFSKKVRLLKRAVD
ncbi:hypothetical protein C2869_22010 (plasmid) [Saccharobesus litoralis]|uniref:Uncharacterized protein n=2 Tax=Saccharobesus litoralis TaxID=2172099 RepID=A0A2S0VYH3_9ALTE|nr:hypothetical protein C2869_22010 [Saccharobesus litoralis]